MYKVTFCFDGEMGDKRLAPIVVFEAVLDIEAVQFALSLHQASNVPHTVDVWKCSSVSSLDDLSICSLIKEAK